MFTYVAADNRPASTRCFWTHDSRGKEDNMPSKQPKRTEVTGRMAEEKLAKYNKNGWLPVPYNHHPEPVRRAIKAAHLRPAMKQCYQNSQRLMVCQNEVKFKYYEGLVGSIIPLQHAWLELDGKIVDVTLDKPLEVLARYECSAEEIRLHMIQTRTYGPVHEDRLAMLQTAVMFGITVTDDYEEVEKQVRGRLGLLRGLDAR